MRVIRRALSNHEHNKKELEEEFEETLPQKEEKKELRIPEVRELQDYDYYEESGF